MKRILSVIALLLCAGTLSFGQQMQVLPNDPETKVGKLDNGLTYYIRHNEKPAQRAEFYLATHAGAILETPDQDGLAHFLEHMCFNGTKNFPEKGILNWLESIGASFGGNVNASTGVEQTIYMLTDIPLSRPTVVDSCLLVLHDYSHFVLCEPEEIDAERGVIIEEKRTRNTASWRNSEAVYGTVFKGSKYENALSLLIGSEENLKSFKPESLLNYYHSWYRPDNQAIIVVGDVDVDEVEAKIKSTFADIDKPASPLNKEAYMVPDNKEPIIGIFTDPEMMNSSIQAVWKSEARPIELNNTPTGLMMDLLQDIISTVMNERFADIAAKPDAPFINANFSLGQFTETSDGVTLTAQNADDKILTAFEAALTEAEKMHRYGFTDAEVERAKTEILSQYEAIANAAPTRRNSQFISPIIDNFFENRYFIDPATQLQVVQALMAQLPAAVVNQVAQASITEDNMVVIYSGPKKDGFVNPTESQILDIVRKVRNSEIEQPEAEDIPTELLDASRLKGSKIKKTVPFIYGSKKLTLSNGLEVILLPTDYEKDRVIIKLEKKGGQSLVATEDLPSLEENIWALYLNNTGLADYSKTTLTKMLSGKQASATPFINDFTHGISASSTVKDLETAFQLLYLSFTRPRFDSDEYNQGYNQIKAVLPNYITTPDYKRAENIMHNFYNSPRKIFLSPEALEKASLQTLDKVYHNLFCDVAGATVIIVGDFTEESILPLVRKYLGSLPKGKKSTDWKYTGDGYVKGKVVSDFRVKMETPKVSVTELLHYDTAYSTATDVIGYALASILDMVYVDTMREEEGGTYGASAMTDIKDEPNPHNALLISFDTNEQQADHLRELALKAIKDIADAGPDSEKFSNAKKNLEKIIPEEKLKNAFWMSSLSYGVLYNNLDYVNEYEAAVKALTPEMVKDMAKAFLDSGNFLESVMRPE